MKIESKAAHWMLVAAWHTLKHQTCWQHPGEDYFMRLNHQAIRRRCLRQLDKLGYRVTLEAQAA